MTCCEECNFLPCVWEDNKDVMLEEMKNEIDLDNEERNIIRKRCYRFFSNFIDGFLGKGIRRELPVRVVSGIKKKFPNTNKAIGHMGFREI